MEAQDLKTPFVSLAVCLVLTACAQSESASKVEAHSEAPALIVRERTVSFPAPDRPVARIVTNHSGPENERDADNEAGQTLALLPLKAGVTVADIGAGEGYYTVRLARRLGRDGQVIATDVVPEYLERLKARIAREKPGNVSFVLGAYDDPKLPPASADVVLMVRMYHEIEQPYAFMWRLHDALKPGGMIAISERARETQYHGTPKNLLRCELEAVGFRQVSVTDLADARGNAGKQSEMGYVALFTPVGLRPDPTTIVPCKDED
jgi:predicted methyltransferase